MMSILLNVPALLVVAFLTLARPQVPLPFYSDVELTPSWSPVAHRVGAFKLTDQRGQAFTDADLAGKVYVASFIYTRCSLVCPVLVKGLRQVQKETAGTGIEIVSYSVTPDIDTPDVLATFGQERGIDPTRWHLLTGDRQTIYGLARTSYFADDARVQSTLADPDAFLHTEKLVLVDQKGRLRGVYDGTLPRERVFEACEEYEAAIRAEKTAFYAPQLLAYRKAAAALHRLPPSRVSLTLAFMRSGDVVDVGDVGDVEGGVRSGGPARRAHEKGPDSGAFFFVSLGNHRGGGHGIRTHNPFLGI